MVRKSPNVICIPIVERIEEKVKRTLWKIDNEEYEKKYGKENVRYDYYPVLDENGNIITKCDIYITKERVRFRYAKRKNICKGKKLFEPCNGINNRKEEENE